MIENCYAVEEIYVSTGTIMGGIAATIENGAIIRNCVAAMPRIRTGSTLTTLFRITNNANPAWRTNNYALDTMLIGASPVSNTDPNSTHGTNATITQLKSKVFYQNVLRWDFTKEWKIDKGNDLPKIKGFV